MSLAWEPGAQQLPNFGSSSTSVESRVSTKGFDTVRLLKISGRQILFCNSKQEIANSPIPLEHAFPRFLYHPCPRNSSTLWTSGKPSLPFFPGLSWATLHRYIFHKSFNYFYSQYTVAGHLVWSSCLLEHSTPHLSFRISSSVLQYYHHEALVKQYSQLKPTQAKFTTLMELGIVWPPMQLELAQVGLNLIKLKFSPNSSYVCHHLATLSDSS